MRIAVAILKELLGLFVDDGRLALLTLIVVAIVGLLAQVVPTWAPGCGWLLLAGCVAILSVTTLSRTDP